jgi:Tautomerase enzyme
MVFVRVHLIKGRLSAQQKQDLGDKLIQAVADVEGLVNNDHHWKRAGFNSSKPSQKTGTPRSISPAPTPTLRFNST